MKSVEELARQLNIPAEIVKTANNYDIKMYGRSVNNKAATKLLISARMQKYPLTVRDLEKETDIDRKSLGRSYRSAIMQLNIIPPIDEPVIYVESMAKALGVNDPSIIAKVKNLVSKKSLAGSDPTAVVAAAFYNNLNETQGKISKTVNVSTVTIRSLAKKLKE